jgi:asparagine synthase (glutamine-hydrolysing)
MCGIVCLFDAKQKTEILRPQVLEMSKKIRHRGPDWSGVFQDKKVIFSHERLAIVDPASGKQPLFSKDGKIVLAVNGEIYNHRELKEEFPNYEFQTQSDCEVILALYEKYGKNFIEKLNGIFAFSLYDTENDVYLIAHCITVGTEMEAIM